jgi:DNA polymerase IV
MSFLRTPPTPASNNGNVRREASVLHLDLDAFFASVEQRDKPSLRGKPVVVGGIGQRGVVATASYEARVFGVRSAMSVSEARRRCPHAAFLAGRFGAYRQASEKVMRILRELSPLVEPLSLDEAFVDLLGATRPIDLSPPGLRSLVRELKTEVSRQTGGLTASAGIGTSKFVAKVASELDKPDGLRVIEPGTEVVLLRPMPVGVIPGVGPVTQERLHRIGVRTVADLQAVGVDELARLVGQAHGQALIELAYARDDRDVEPERESKSISVEDTFETDVVDAGELSRILARDAGQVAARLRAARLFARTVTIKIRHHDFTTHTRSRTLLGATDQFQVINDVAQSLLSGVDTAGGLRLLGVGVAGLTDVLQEALFGADGEVADESVVPADLRDSQINDRRAPRWIAGADIQHDDHGRGWIWGSGLGRVTVRFESRDTPPGPIRTFPIDDPKLHLVQART